MVSHSVSRRSGASLLEVLIATVVLLTVMAALTSQALLGTRAAKRAQLQTMASAICQSLLEEQLAASRLDSTPASPVPGASGWMAQTKVELLNDSAATLDRNRSNGLCLISVTAWRRGSDERLSKLTLSRVARASAKLKSASMMEQP